MSVAAVQRALSAAAWAGTGLGLGRLLQAPPGDLPTTVALATLGALGIGLLLQRPGRRVLEHARPPLGIAAMIVAFSTMTLLAASPGPRPDGAHAHHMTAAEHAAMGAAS